MSYAVMPMTDYKAMCDKVREKVDVSVVMFEDTDFEFVRSSEFVVEESGTYTFTIEVKDESKLNIYNIYYALSDWANNSSPGVFEIIDNKTMSAYFYSGRVYRIFIGDYNGLKASDILSATLSYNGEIVENFVETNKIKSGEMPSRIDEVYQAGRKDEQTEFWEVYQDGGKRTNYNTFCGATSDTTPIYWSDINYNPIYPITPTNGYSIFGSNKKITDTKVPIIMKGTSMDYAFGGCALKTIRSLDISTVTSYTSTFYLCYALENITFVGTVKVNISLVYSSNLTRESALSLINALADFSQDTSGKTHKVTFKNTTLAKLTDEEKAIATNKGWTIA